MSVSRNGEIYYTEDEMEKAAQNKNALKYALSRGYHLIKSGSEYRLKEHDSMVFELNGKWHWNSRGLHGDALDFIQAYENYSFKEAVCLLAGTLNDAPPVSSHVDVPIPTAEDKKEFILPERADNFKILFAYLIKERCLDPDLVKDFVNKRKIYQGVTYSKIEIVGYDKDGHARYDIKERYKNEFKNVSFEKVPVNNGQKNQPLADRSCLPVPYVEELKKNGIIRPFNNLVMVGYDQEGFAHYASQRSMSSFGEPFKVDVTGSDKSYSFLIEGKPNSDTVCVFESPVECMSYWSLCKETGSQRINDYLLSQGGAGSLQGLDRFLSDHPNIKNIVSGLNNDSEQFGHEINAGWNGTQKIVETYGEKYNVTVHRPHLNDWNDVLKNYRHNLKPKMHSIDRQAIKVNQISKPRKGFEMAI